MIIPKNKYKRDILILNLSALVIAAVLIIIGVVKNGGDNDIGVTTFSTTATSSLISETQTTATEPLQTTFIPVTTYTVTPVTTPETLPAADFFSTLEISASHCVVYDALSQKTLYEKSADEKCYPASVTKLLTAIVAVSEMQLDEICVVGSEIKLVGYNSSTAGLKEGQRLTLEHLLYGLLLPSGNDAAYTIAVNVAHILYGADITEQEAIDLFMHLVNKKAESIGASNTNFTCPDGYHDDTHYTTARDMLKVSVYAAGIPVIGKIVASTMKTVVIASGEEITWYNSNAMINGGSVYYSKYVTGMKTGCTSEAGYCIAISAVKNGRSIYIMLFGSPNASERNLDAKRIIDKLFNE